MHLAYSSQRKALDEVLNTKPYDRASELQLVATLAEKIAKLEKVKA